MPVTAKLSRKFYERFGDDIAAEFVDWFNAVDADYRTQLREANDLNWERFKAELAAVEARLRSEFQMGLAALQSDLRSELHTEIASVRKDMADFRNELLKWMFIYWTGAVVTLGGLIIALSGRH